MTRMFYSDDEDGRKQHELDLLAELGDSLEQVADALETALGPAIALEEAREFAKMEFYESHGHWPTDQELDRSGTPIRPLPGSPWA
jgi:hypothetical protein